MNHQTRCHALTLSKTTRATPTRSQIQIAAPAILPSVLNEFRDVQYKPNRLQTTFAAINDHRIQSIVRPLPKSQFAHSIAFVSCHFWESSIGSKRRRLRTVKSFDQNRVAKVVMFVSEEFALVIDRCHSRDASQTYGVRSSVQIQAMSEFEKWIHVLTRFGEDFDVPSPTYWTRDFPVQTSEWVRARWRRN